MRNIILTALAPIFWGTTYVITTELLPENRPLLVAAIRALPIGMLLVMSYRILPKGIWWWRSLVLGALNIGLFFALLFVATYRLIGGIAAAVGAIQPLLVILFSWPLFGQRPQLLVALAAGIGVVGVGLLVLDPTTQLDLLGVAAAMGATLAMAGGIALTKYWGRPAPLIVFTGWQLTAGGLILVPLAMFFEGELPSLTLSNMFGFTWLALLNTGLAYALWFKGIEQLKAWQVSFLGLLSPIVAVFAGFLILGQTLSPIQITGTILTFSSLVVVQRLSNVRTFTTQPQLTNIKFSS
ncbi:MAG: EamA family transporter [Anaerolineales bacterium]|nr:EamA family transporter [Anaerolineales bacterium]